MMHYTVIALRPRRPGDAPLNEQRVLFDAKASITTVRHLAQAHVDRNPASTAHVFIGSGTRGRLVYTVHSKQAPNGAWVIA
jgi:hypothetical protein